MAEATDTLDLHALGAPPAFTLSQDQTLLMRTLLPSTIQLLRCLPPAGGASLRRHQRASSVILPPFPGPVNTPNRAIFPDNGANFARPPPQSRPQRLPGPRRNPESPLAPTLNCPLSRTPPDAGRLAGLPRSARIILAFDLAGHPGYYGARGISPVAYEKQNGF